MFHGSFEALLGITLWFFVVAILPEVVIAMLVLRPVLARKMRRENVKAADEGEYDEVFKRIVAPVKEEIAILRLEVTSAEVPDISQEFEDFEARFTAAYTEDMLAIQEEMKKIPLRVSGIIHGEKGNETLALQAYLDKEGVEIDEAVERAEGDFMLENPDTMAALALKHAYEADVSDDYRAENPIKAGIFDFAKARFLPEIQAAFSGRSGPPRLGAGKTRLSSGKIYGT